MNRFTKILYKSFQINKFCSANKFVNFSECRKFCTVHTKFSQISNLQRRTNFLKCNTVLALSLLTWLGFAKEDEKKESELIMTLKRAVLCIQREQFEKAEQMLHLALRIAQQQQNQQGIIYSYDLMANLAFEQHDLNKAHTLFVTVLQMLLGNGTAEDDLKAAIGYKWCLDQIDKKKNESVDSKVLYGVINDWYAQFLLDTGETNKAVVHLKKAHRICKEIVGENSEQAVLLLNDLGTTSFRADDMVNAEKYLKEAISMGVKLDDKSHLGVIQANLGLILLEKGIFDLAEKYCNEAWQTGKKYENDESINQAKYCLDQIKMNLKDKAKS